MVTETPDLHVFAYRCFFLYTLLVRSAETYPESVVVARSPDDIRELLFVGIGRQFFAYINIRIDIAAGFQRRTRDVFQYDLLMGGRGQHSIPWYDTTNNL